MEPQPGLPLPQESGGNHESQGDVKETDPGEAAGEAQGGLRTRKRRTPPREVQQERRSFPKRAPAGPKPRENVNVFSPAPVRADGEL
mmetsp:Transcript_34373/g.96904  ORF Transcript_34373/g.96904 Transcript_34373/m.96904 type:complete len:87 (-) Transcript_34373:18-278(-)